MTGAAEGESPVVLEESTIVEARRILEDSESSTESVHEQLDKLFEIPVTKTLLVKTKASRTDFDLL